nr:Dihydrofolate reductase [uncultured bacterium]
MKTFIIAAVTADGLIGESSSQSSLEWTSAEDKKLFVTLTKEAGVMIMGSSTFATIGRGLPGRKTFVYTSRPDEFADIEGVEPTSLEPAALLARLEAEGFTSAAICGGKSIYTMFLASGLVDELYLTVEPVILGDGVRLADSLPAVGLTLLESRNLNQDTVLLHYAVKK